MLTLLALASNAALAHGDAMHATAKKPYDPAKVEERAFGHEGNPKRVSRVVRLEMSDAMRFTPAEVTVSAARPSASRCAMVGSNCMRWCWAQPQNSRSTRS